jgi:maltose alpha-D-glucosyltransferase/alpha-amylase
VLKRIRAEIDTHYANRMILAEANQWPSDVRPYFGDGDECHMTFHFPLMPRIYMALRQEDRLPITDIMAQTPDIPDTCQWGLFLRNHDELTLEMVTTDERDYMYLAYSADPRMRINLGIRRRLAPLLDNNRRRIELLNSLLFSFPGTPIIYYGDEIGMGDNIYLGDRNGVRTPMQWSGDRNAGFSRAIPAKLYSPVIMDPVFGYEAINVEAQQSDQASLLNWMRNMIALRKLFRVFGRGTLEFLHPANRKILAYLRQYDGEQVLCVANLSRFAQPVDLELSALEGMVPIEMLGYVEFPRITKQPYRLTLGPYSFLWLELHETPEPVAEIPLAESEESRLSFAGGWSALLDGPAPGGLESALNPEYVSKQRWFQARGRRVESARISDWAALDAPRAALCVLAVSYDDGPQESYFLPLAISCGKKADGIRETSPNSIISPVSTPDGDGILHDGLLDDELCAALSKLIESGVEVRTRYGLLRGNPDTAATKFQERLVEAHGAVQRPPVDHENSSVIHSEKFILKLRRRYETGTNPEVEVGRRLTEQMHFEAILPFAGSLEYVADQTEPATSAILQRAVENEGDGWKWTLEELDRYYEHCAPLAYPHSHPFREKTDFFELSEEPVSDLAREHVGIYLDAAATLGRRTAQMHLALSSVDDPAFAPEPETAGDLRFLSTQFRENAIRTFDALKASVSRLPDDVVETAGLALGRRRRVLDFFKQLEARQIQAPRIRIHGNYHLGSVLRVKTDYVIIDFEADPSLSLAENRVKHSPLKDVASMLRSFSYGAYATLMNYTARRPVDFGSLVPWARLCERSAACAFLHAYRETAAGANYLPGNPEDFRLLLQGYVMDKALNELHYELDARPAWARIPLEGILSLSL